jgi:alpha-amylase/alpha-mannosidase (GH57 family)
MTTTTAMPRLWICIHGHFYQPPRDNPWLDEIEPQPSAAPYRDWNERITAECYRPNSAARVLDKAGKISEISDNYQRISFNFGPTLLDYLHHRAPDVHDAIVAADRASINRFSGHGSALAQAHSHLILPLCSPRDRQTQIRWGAADFEHRFGRRPEGMWLPECAVDTATLEALVDEGITFTVLAPRQADAVRAPGGSWQRRDVDTRRGYRCPLPSGRSIDLFFYDGAAAQAVAFEHLLRDGRDLARRLMSLPPIDGDTPSLSHIATDGESYGHHHRFGEMALAVALSAIEGDSRFRLTNYAEMRALVPPTWEVRIVEPSSWSCAHGVSRWCDDCGCNTGAPGVHQRWRRPLREALDWLRDRCHATIDAMGAELFEDPWRARNSYIAVLLGEGSQSAQEQFFAKELRSPSAKTEDSPGEVRKRALAVMELGRAAMLMFTSCGWFFDDISGIETVQVMRYAARAIELQQRLTGEDLESQFRDRLALAPGNHTGRPEIANGEAIWRSQISNQRLDLVRIARHVAVATVVADDTGATPFGVASEIVARRELREGELQLVSGTIRLRSRWLDDPLETHFACLRRGSQVVGRLGSTDSLAPVIRELGRWLDRPDAALAMMTAHAGIELDLGCLLPIATAWIEDVFAAPIAELDTTIYELHDRNLALAHWLVRQNAAPPPVLAAVTRLALRRRLIGAIKADPLDVATAETCLEQAGKLGVSLDTAEIALAAAQGMTREVESAWKLLDLSTASSDEEAVYAATAALERAARIGETVRAMKTPLDLWQVQNLTLRLLRRPPSSTAAIAMVQRLAISIGVAIAAEPGRGR